MTVQDATVDGSYLILTFNEGLKESFPSTSRFSVSGTDSTTSVTAVEKRPYGGAMGKKLLATISPAVSGPSLAGILEQLRERAGKRAGPVLRAGATGLILLARGPWLSWLPLAFLARLPWLGIAPLALNFGRRCYRTGLVVRRSAEELKPVRLFEEIVREIALEGPR